MAEKRIGEIPQRWRQLSGEDNWENLLFPLDTDLRNYILHYGEMAQAAYDTFNSQKLSKYCGSSIYARNDLFLRVGLITANPFQYKAVKYIYGTSTFHVPEAFIVTSLSSESIMKQSNWVGYVAVATDEGKLALGRRDILIVWRGTVQPIEWVKDLDIALAPTYDFIGTASDNANVHRGFWSIYTSYDVDSQFNQISAREQVLSEVKRQVERFKNEEMSITLTGHSMGGALSTLTASDIVYNEINKLDDNTTIPVTAITFGSPRLGDPSFHNLVNSMQNIHILDIRNKPDIVVTLPLPPFTSNGIKFEVNSQTSPFLKLPGDVATWHSLEGAYMHSVSGTSGTHGEFDVRGVRCISLVNKMSSSLKDEYLIPEYWVVIKDKGMHQKSDGTWTLRDHEKDDNDDD